MSRHGQVAFLAKFGLLGAHPLTLSEASQSLPKYAKRRTRINQATVAYGHGLAVTPMHLIRAYAILVNGGHWVQPTLIKVKAQHAKSLETETVISAETSALLRHVLGQVTLRGTASQVDFGGYDVIGKTGTADKVDPVKGGYFQDKVLASFVGSFPADKPRYIFLMALDEPQLKTKAGYERTASKTVVPYSAEFVRNIAPLLYVEPNPSLVDS